MFKRRRGRVYLGAVTAGILVFLILLITYSIAVYQGPFAFSQVSLSEVSCKTPAGVCSMVLTNTGQARGVLAGCAFTDPLGDGTLSPDSSVPPGGTLQVTCALSGNSPTPGYTATGRVYTTNGGYFVFNSTWT